MITTISSYFILFFNFEGAASLGSEIRFTFCMILVVKERNPRVINTTKLHMDYEM